MAHIVGIRFHGGGKTYHFNASSVPEIKKGEYVIVETSRGQQLGQVVSLQDPGGKKAATGSLFCVLLPPVTW